MAGQIPVIAFFATSVFPLLIYHHFDASEYIAERQTRALRFVPR